MNNGAPLSHYDDLEVVVLAPVGRDAAAAADVLRNAEMNATTIPTLGDLCERVTRPLGAVLIAEEAITAENADCLRAALAKQQPWSNLPVILMTSRAERVFSTEKFLAVFGEGCAITLLERPFRFVTLVASVRVALQARAKQYQVRDLLHEQTLAVQQRDEFLSIASHELKTPLTSLKIQVQMRKRYLQRGDASLLSAEKMAQFVAKTEIQIDRLSRLVDDMLDISRIDNGKLALNFDRVELGDLVTEVVESFLPLYQAANCELTYEIRDRVHGCWDRYRLEQVITNLLSNALKYGHCKPVHVIAAAEGGGAVLRVRDNGPGIPREKQPYIFDRYERADAQKDISGLGLGLYITRQIVEMHAGKIRVESRDGQGAEFVVELPAGLTAAAPAKPSRQTTPSVTAVPPPEPTTATATAV